MHVRKNNSDIIIAINNLQFRNGKVAQITKERESWWVYGKVSQHTHKTINQSINQSLSLFSFQNLPQILK